MHKDYWKIEKTNLKPYRGSNRVHKKSYVLQGNFFRNERKLRATYYMSWTVPNHMLELMSNPFLVCSKLWRTSWIVLRVQHNHCGRDRLLP